MTAGGPTRADWAGLGLFDVDGAKIGTIEHTIPATGEDELEWLVVDSGISGAEKMLVPASEVRTAGDRVTVTHTKHRVAGAPKVEDDQALSEDDKGKLCRYYGLQYDSSSGGEPAEGCEDMPDSRPAG